MLSYDSNLMRALGIVGNYCLLNFLWILFSLPVITVFPATVAMFGIMKEWRKGAEPPVISTFFSIFKTNLIKSCLIGVIQITCAIIFVVDFQVLWNMEGSIKVILIPIFMLLGFIFLSISIYLYPLIVHFESPLKPLLKNAFILSTIRPLQSIMILIVFGLMFYICTIARFLPFVCAFSVCGMVNYKMVVRTLIKVNNKTIKLMQ